MESVRMIKLATRLIGSQAIYSYRITNSLMSDLKCEGYYKTKWLPT